MGEVLKGVSVLHLAAADSMLNPNLLDQLLYLRALGMQVSTASIDGPLARRLRDEHGFEWHSLSMSREFSPLGDLRSLHSIAELCRRGRWQIVHTHTPKGNVVGQWGARLAGVPIVLQTLHGFYFHERMNPVLRRAWIEIERFSATHSDRVLCQNAEDVDTALRENIVAPERLEWLGNGIDLQRFRPATEDARRAARRKFGIPENAFVVGMVARFVKEKGFDEFLQAIGTLADVSSDFHFLGVGHRVSSERLHEIFSAEEHPVVAALGQRLTLLYDRDDMDEVYASMDVNILPSWREGFPRTLMEGAACGLPQVATNIRGCRQVVLDGKTGALIEPGDTTALAAHIGKFREMPALCKKMGRAARRQAEEQFDQKVVFDKVAANYRTLLRKK